MYFPSTPLNSEYQKPTIRLVPGIGKSKSLLSILALFAVLSSCTQDNKENGETTAAQNTVDTAQLPPPDTTASKTRFSKVIGWPDGKTPVAPPEFTVSKFAEDFQNPRWIYQAPNGDIFVAESATESSAAKKAKDIVTGKAKASELKGSADRITILRDTNNDGKPDVREAFLTDLNQPFGMLVLGNFFYVANTDAVMIYPYKAGQTRISAPGKKILSLPAGGYNNHWTRNIIANSSGTKIYISVGSGSNVAENGMENELRRANIIEINPDGTAERIFASGLRNPVGMAWSSTGELWTAVNERDGLGDNLVPDYITSVQDGAFYGWPFSYFGQHEDPRLKGKNPGLVKKAIAPDVPLGAHTASLGLAFYDKDKFPASYHNGAFIGQHGSWNRGELSGYKVVFVPFKGGKPSGKVLDFLTGFIADPEKDEVYGRPVGLAVLADGSLLVADDAANTIWRISVK